MTSGGWWLLDGGALQSSCDEQTARIQSKKQVWFLVTCLESRSWTRGRETVMVPLVVLAMMRVDLPPRTPLVVTALQTLGYSRTVIA